MAMGTERSKALHNFTMPCDLRWGNQRFLRCMKVNSDGQASPLRRFDNTSANSSDHHHQRRTARDRDKDEFLNGSISEDDDHGIAATREKVMLDLQTAADKMKVAFFKDGLEEGEVSVSLPLPPPPAEGEAYRPWNLRTRRAACKMPASGGPTTTVGAVKVDAPRPDSGLAATGQKSPVLRSDGNGTAGEKRERAKFSVPLSKRDIEEDFFAMVGHRPPRRPKKRARIVQRQLDTLFPGLWLTEVTPDMYKVPEAAP